MRPTPDTATADDFMKIDFTRGAVLREPIFYTGESAYASQYRDFAPLKYRADEEWLEESRLHHRPGCHGWSGDPSLEQVRLEEIYNGLRAGIPENFTLLLGFTFTPQEVTDQSGENETTVRNVLNAFSVAEARSQWHVSGAE